MKKSVSFPSHCFRVSFQSCRTIRTPLSRSWNRHRSSSLYVWPSWSVEKPVARGMPPQEQRRQNTNCQKRSESDFGSHSRALLKAAREFLELRRREAPDVLEREDHVGVEVAESLFRGTLLYEEHRRRPAEGLRVAPVLGETCRQPFRVLRRASPLVERRELPLHELVGPEGARLLDAGQTDLA